MSNSTTHFFLHIHIYGDKTQIYSWKTTWVSRNISSNFVFQRLISRQGWRKYRLMVLCKRPNSANNDCAWLMFKYFKQGLIRSPWPSFVLEAGFIFVETFELVWCHTFVDCSCAFHMIHFFCRCLCTHQLRKMARIAILSSLFIKGENKE